MGAAPPGPMQFPEDDGRQPAEPPQSGDEILREVERLKREPMRFKCFGMSFGLLVIVLALALLLWWLLR